MVDEFNRVSRDQYEALRAVGALTEDMPVARVQLIHISRIQANGYNPNAVAADEMRLLHTSISEDGYCVEERTPVLTAELVWKPAGELKVGERIVAFDEERSSGGPGNELARKFRTAVVTSNYVDESDLVEVVTEKGSVFTTPDHPWLASSNHGDASQRQLKWITSEQLKPGDDLRHFADPWEVETGWEAGWLAGFLDGEGCLSRSNGQRQLSMKLSGSQRPGPTSDKMVEMMSKYGDPRVFTLDRARFPNQQDNVQCVFNRVASIMRVLGSVRPQRLIEGAGEFWDGISTVRALGRVKVLEVKQAARGRIARLSTSTGTFIGAGFAMHNTMPIVAIWDDRWDILLPCLHFSSLPAETARRLSRLFSGTPRDSSTEKDLLLPRQTRLLSALGGEYRSVSLSEMEEKISADGSQGFGASDASTAVFTESVAMRSTSGPGTLPGSETSSTFLTFSCPTCESSDPERKKSWTSYEASSLEFDEEFGLSVNWISSESTEKSRLQSLRRFFAEAKLPFDSSAESLTSNLLDTAIVLDKGLAIIVDGFHRYTTMRMFQDIADRNSGYLPVSLIEKDISDRIASTVRHNRARGKHSVAGMGTLVFQMLEAGEDDLTICQKIGVDVEELARLKHLTGYSKLYGGDNAKPYSNVVLTGSQMKAKADYKKENPDEHVPQF